MTRRGRRGERQSSGWRARFAPSANLDIPQHIHRGRSAPPRCLRLQRVRVCRAAQGPYVCSVPLQLIAHGDGTDRSIPGSIRESPRADHDGDAGGAAAPTWCDWSADDILTRNGQAQRRTLRLHRTVLRGMEGAQTDSICHSVRTYVYKRFVDVETRHDLDDL